MKNQIFISYRRENGEVLAHLIYERLTNENYKVFLDVESLLSGKFNEKLYEVIQECTDFVLILPPNGLDRCSDPGDWVRLEIECALRCRKNIVLIMMRGFSFPERLPESLKELPHYNGIMANFELFDGTMDKLKRMLHSKAAGDTIPVTCDPDFSGKYKINCAMNRFNGIQDVFGFSPFTQNNYLMDLEDRELNPEGLLGDTMKLFGEEALTPRTAVRDVRINEKTYRIFEVFRYNQKKYAYAVEWNIPYTLQQKGAFFELSDDGSVYPAGSESGSILLFYCLFIRMLDIIPQCLLESCKNSMEALFHNKNILSESYMEQMGLSGIDFNKAVSLFTSKWNPGYTVSRINGWVPRSLLGGKKPLCINNSNIPLSVADTRGSDFDRTGIYYIDFKYDKGRTTPFLARSGRCKVKTPLDGYTIIDIVKLFQFKDCFVAFAYPQIDYCIDVLEKKPVYFYIKRDDDLNLSIEKIQEKNLKCYLEDCGVLERFTLIAMQIETFFDSVFEHDVNLKYR